ncbi:MAG: hypothetical protein Q8K46_04440, partial [Deltaproteobacteria bacterium]|nr:hypothetical protein [Deltaproteobacteria bacterium]
AKKLRAELDASFGQEYAILLDIMGKMREERMAQGCPAEENKRIFTALVNSDILDHIRTGNPDGIINCLRDVVAMDRELTGLEKTGKG